MPTPTPAPRRTEYLPLEDLQPDPRNPKAHDLGVIDASVGRFGMIDQVVRDDRTGYIISGHGRTKTLRAMRERGESAPEGVQVTEDGTWLVPVTVGWSSRTDAEAGAALIALNKTTELGGWDDEALLDILDDLASEDGAGLDGVGFEFAEIEGLRSYLDSAEVVDTFTIAASAYGSEGGGGDLDAPGSLPEGLSIPASDPTVRVEDDSVTLSVVVRAEQRAEAYGFLKGQPWILDVRDAK